VPFQFSRLEIPDVVLVKRAAFGDDRGFFAEAYRRSSFVAFGITATFEQDAHSRSRKGTLRGLHYQKAPMAQGKLVWPVSGRILDVCLEVGGSITGEHGVGVDKRRHMPKMFAEGDLDAFARLRCAFDPAGLANPGKVMPTPRLCGEVPGPYRAHPLETAGLAERF